MQLSNTAHKLHGSTLNERTTRTRDTYQQLAPLGIIKAELDNLEFLIEGATEHGLHCVDWNEYTEFSIPWEQLASVVYYGLDPIWERDGVVCSDLVKLGA